jgi:hypothetical protein
MFVWSPAHVEQLGSHWMDFSEILYLSILEKSVKKVEVPLKSYERVLYVKPSVHL